jgi:hypothetical protein
MQTSFKEIFRRDPKIGIGIGTLLLCLGIGGFVSEFSDYRNLGKSPQELTIELAMPSPTSVPNIVRFVSLPGGLIPDCSQALVQRSGSGDVNGRIVLASDASHERWFAIHLKGDAKCESASGPMVGILQKAAPGLPAWLRDKGMTVPESSYPLMDMSVDDGPGLVALMLWVFGGMGLLGLIMILYVLRLEPSSAVRPVALARVTVR